MGNTLVVNATVEQTRVALLDNDTVVELLVERRKDRGLVGNIYKGRVQRVLPGMQAAFVDVGLERAAFLYVGDLVDPARRDDVEDGADSGDAEAPKTPPSPPRRRVGRIEDRLRSNQEILVQISKEPIGTKGARITAHVSLPGRHLVFMPTVDHVGISRRITDEPERERLRQIIETLRPPRSGFVVRTVAEGVEQRKLEADMEFLINLWADVQRREANASAPALVHPDLDVVLRATRDLFTADIERLVVDDPETHERVVRFVRGFAPALARSIELYDDSTPIFEHFGVEIEVQRAFSPKVWLKSGGYIVWDEAEALTVVDVNTGRFVGRRDLEDTITRTNLEAVREIGYQLRLRNVGGVVVIDFIDMEDPQNRARVLEAMEEALKHDRARTHVMGMSELGLVELTRQRVRESLLHTFTEACPYCEGKGFVLSAQSVAYDMFRALRRAANERSEPCLLVRCHPEVATYVYDEEADVLEEIEAWSGKRIVVREDATRHRESFNVEGADADEACEPRAAEGEEGT